MNKKLGIVLGAVVAVGLIASLAVGSVGAQSATPQSQVSAQATPQATPKAKAGPQGQGAPGGPGSSMNDIATLLGMTTDEIWAARVQGKTLADLAKDKGVDTQTLVDALVANQKTMVDQAVTDGRLTQAQADKWIEWYKQAAALQLTEPYGLGRHGDLPGGMRGGPGGMRGGPGGRGDVPGGMPGPRSGDQSDATPPAAPAQ